MDIRSAIMGIAFVIMWSSAFSSARVIVLYAPPVTSLSIRFLISDASNGFSGRRMLAIRWKDDLPVDEAAAKASDAIAWTGFGAQGVHPKSTATMFRRD